MRTIRVTVLIFVLVAITQAMFTGKFQLKKVDLATSIKDTWL